MTDFSLQYRRSNAPEKIVKAAEAYEKKFGIRLETLRYFPRAMRAGLHQPEGDPTQPPGGVTIASAQEPTILQEMAVLDRVANSPSPTRAERERYRAAL